MKEIDQNLKIALLAKENWIHGLETGNWVPYLEMVTDDYEFWLSRLDDMGHSYDITNMKERITQPSLNQRRLQAYRYKPNRIVVSALNVAFEFMEDINNANLKGGSTCLVLSFDLDKQKISACREYQCVLITG